MDVEVRNETVGLGNCRHAIVQLPLQPAYALTVHKVQALSIERWRAEGVPQTLLHSRTENESLRSLSLHCVSS